MKGWKGSALTILVLLMLFGSSAVNVATAATAKIVSDVGGFQNYVPGDNRFTHGNTIQVYTEMSNVNYEGFVFVEFVFIIKDPRGNVVSMDRIDLERRDYNDHAYVVYSKKIPAWWLYGNYKLDIYTYDRIKKAKIWELKQKMERKSTLDALLAGDDSFEDLENFFESGSDADDLGVLKSFSDSEKEMARIRFLVCREEEIEPAEFAEGTGITESDFTITNVGIDKFTVGPNETVSISVTVENKGARKTRDIKVDINGETAAEEAVTLDYLASKTLHFAVKRNVPGSYKVTIPGTEIVRVFFVEEINEKTGNSTASAPPAPGTQQLGEDGGGEAGLLNYVFDLSIAFIALLATVMILLKVNSKQFSSILNSPRKYWDSSKRYIKRGVARPVNHNTLNFSRSYR